MSKLHPGRYFNFVDIGHGALLLLSGFTLCIDLAPTECTHLISINRGELLNKVSGVFDRI